MTFSTLLSSSTEYQNFFFSKTCEINDTTEWFHWLQEIQYVSATLVPLSKHSELLYRFRSFSIVFQHANCSNVQNGQIHRERERVRERKRRSKDTLSAWKRNVHVTRELTLEKASSSKKGMREREREGVWARALGGCITRAYNAIAGRLKRPLAWTGREKKRRITGGHVVLREQVHASATGVWTKLLLLLLLLGQFVRASRLEFRVARVLSTIVQQRTTWTTAQNYYVFHGFVIGSINGTEPTIRVYVRVCVHFPVWFYPRLARQCLGNCTNSSIYSLRQ